jgi:thiamine biosynthesis lipoprotein
MRFSIIFCGLSLLLASCETNEPVGGNSTDESQYVKLTGNTQGTTYKIVYLESKGKNYQTSIDSLLAAYDMQLSTYKENSIISQFNAQEDHIFDLSKFPNHQNFEACYNQAKDVYYSTNGSFNPALYPIVKYWGFFDGTEQKNISLSAIDSILLLTNFGEEYFSLKENQTLSKKFSNAKLDFNGIAQGHSVDVIADFFDAKNITNYMIEIGGEVTCNGVNEANTGWSIGIDKPIENSIPGEDLQFIAILDNMSLATSGNYRKFYEIDGKKYSHTINPVTGSPVQHNLLSVTVISKSCADADAYATAFMVMGLLNSMNFVNNHPDLELNAYFVFDAGGVMNTSMTKGFEKYIKE